MRNMTRLLADAGSLFEGRFGRLPEIGVVAPGRANLIGEHTDYNDGHVLPIAIDRFVAAAASNRTDRLFHLEAIDFGESFEFDADSPPEEYPLWAAYIMGVAIELEREGFKLRGKDILVLGDVPIGSGLSSSAALEVSTATAIERLEGLEIDDAVLVDCCRRADHHFVGVKSGPMDQFAARACRAGHAGLLDCRSLEMTQHPLPEGIELFSIYSGVPRSLAKGGEYNERQESCQKAVEVLSKADPSIKALRDATPEIVEAEKSALGDLAYRRARHVVSEQRRVFEMLTAFERGDADRVGEILRDGHRSLAEDFEVSLPVLDAMVEWLCRQGGVIGARLTGAGFGGSLICLAYEGMIDEAILMEDFAGEFEGETPEKPQVWELTSVDGARYQPTERYS